MPCIFPITWGKAVLLAGAATATSLALPRPRGSGFSAARVSPRSGGAASPPGPLRRERPCRGLRGPTSRAPSPGSLVPQPRGGGGGGVGDWASPCPAAALGERGFATGRRSGAEKRLPKPRACRGEALNLRATFGPRRREPRGGRAGAALPGGLPVLGHRLLLLLLPGKRGRFLPGEGGCGCVRGN